MNNVLELFCFSSHRVGRTGFVMVVAVLVGLLVATDFLLTHGLPGWAGLIVKLGLGYSALCILSLRLHDRGRSGWLAWLVLLVFALVWPLANGKGPDAANIGALLIMVGIAIDLVIMPGQKGLNRHGPSPSIKPRCQLRQISLS